MQLLSPKPAGGLGHRLGLRKGQRALWKEALRAREGQVLERSCDTFLMQACAFPFSKWVPLLNEPLFSPQELGEERTQN